MLRMLPLPTSPLEDKFEDLVAACVFSMGCFVEANLHLRENSSEILELDVVATPIEDPVANTMLIDAKSGDTGLSDIFKMFGWRTYLNIPKACIFRKTIPTPQTSSAIQIVGRETDVYTTVLNDIAFNPSEIATSHWVADQKLREQLSKAAWYGRIAKRKCVKLFTRHGGSTYPNSFLIAKTYRWNIEQSFFKKTPLERARAVYDAFSTASQITDRVITEISTIIHEDPESVWGFVRDSELHPDVQFVLMMEHTARLRIVKNALLHIITLESQGLSKSSAFEDLVSNWNMPSSYQTGMNVLKEHSHRNTIPFLWQLFIEVFGGFYRTDATNDVDILSQITRIPPEDIPGCLELYGTFFPNNNGWFFNPQNELCIMKNVPAVYHGTGAILRFILDGRDRLSERYPRMNWLVRKWGEQLNLLLQSELP